MRRQSSIWLSAAILVMGAAACKFSDPTSSLRGGPSSLRVTELASTNSGYRPQPTAVGTVTYADLAVAESVTVGVQVLDGQGNYLSFTVPTASAAVATAENLPDNTAIPGGTLWKARIIAVAAGTTTAIVTAAGLADTITV